MELLKELDACCEEKWILRTLGTDKDDSKLRALFQLIHAGTHTEAEMAAVIYGKGTPARHPPYRTLKTRLKEVYLNAILLRDHKVPSYRTYDEAYENGYRLLGVTRLLLRKNELPTARNIAETTFNSVRDFEIILLNQGFTDMLASLYLGSSFNRKKYKKYEELNQYYSQAAYDLSVVSHCYRDIRNCIYSGMIPNLEIGQRAGKYVKQCREIRERYLHVPQVQTTLIFIEVLGLMLRGDYRNAIVASLLGNQILDAVKGVSERNKEQLALLRVDCSIKLKDFKLGKKYIEETKAQYNLSEIHSFAIQKSLIILGLSTRYYDYAYRNLSKINHQAIKRKLPTTDAQSWQVLEAYLNFLIQTKELVIQDDWPKLRRFRIGSFLNSVGEITRNKSGTNIQILIIRFLFSLLQKKHDALIDQAEGLKTYAGRYLKGPENIRNRSFFKLMDLVVRVNFNRLAALKKSKVALKKLENSDGKPGLNDTELVSYEVIWRIMLQQLDVRKRDEQELRQLAPLKN